MIEQTAGKNETFFSVKDFISFLWNNLSPDVEFEIYPIEDYAGLFMYGRKKGWLEDEDERFSDNQVDRRTASRIIHQFMKLELKIPDLADIVGAEILKDLYTCHTCVNHIAQVFLRGFFDPDEVNRDGESCLIFNHLKDVERKDAEKIISRLKELVSD